MIGGDHVDGSVAQRLPEFFVVFALADGRRALEVSGSVGDFLCGESQIVRAGFRSDSKFIRMGLAQQGKRIGGRNVHDVNVGVEFACAAYEQSDGFVLRFARAGRQPGGMFSRGLRCPFRGFLCGAVDGTG